MLLCNKPWYVLIELCRIEITTSVQKYNQTAVLIELCRIEIEIGTTLFNVKPKF